MIFSFASNICVCVGVYKICVVSIAILCPKIAFVVFKPPLSGPPPLSSIERGCYLKISARGISPLVHPSSKSIVQVVQVHLSNIQLQLSTVQVQLAPQYCPLVSIVQVHISIVQVQVRLTEQTGKS